MKYFFCFLIIVFFSSYCFGAERVIPNKDLKYLGAFRVPHTTNNGTDLLYNANGNLSYDPDTNELIIVGNFNSNPTKVGKITIPTPVISANKNVSDLNSASFDGSMIDITNGKQVNGASGFELSSVQYVPTESGQSNPHLIYMIKDQYAVIAPSSYGEDCIGWSDTNFTNIYGLWHLDSGNARAYDESLFMIPQAWADTYLNGMSLGFSRVKPEESNGPTLFVSAPWQDNGGSPPANGTALASKELIDYGNSGHPINIFNRSTDWTDAIWVTINGKAALVYLATVGFRQRETQNGWWYDPEAETYKGGSPDLYSHLNGAIDASVTTIPLVDASDYYAPYWEHIGSEQVYCTGKSGNNLTGCTRGYNSTSATTHPDGYAVRQILADEYYYGDYGDGYDAFPYIPMLVFYDVDQIAQIAAGTRSVYDIQPYAYFALDKYMYTSSAVTGIMKTSDVNGMAYDATNQKIYISEYRGDGNYPLIHVFSLTDTGSTLDTTPPSAPTNFSNNNGVLSWTASSTSNCDYIIFKKFTILNETPTYRPIAVTQNQTWTDPHYSDGDAYKIVAYDQSMNASNDLVPPQKVNGINVIVK